MSRILLVFVFCLGPLAFAEDGRPLPKIVDRGSHAEVQTLTGRTDHVVMSQGILGQCQAGRKLSDGDLVTRLREVANLCVDTKNGGVDRETAIYLLAYFQVMGYRYSDPVTIRMNQPESSRLVQMKDGELHFAKNASHKLFTKKVNDYISQPEDQRSQDPTEFSNRLFEQLTETVSNRELLQRFFKERFDLDIEADPGDAERKYSRRLSDQEAAMVAKQLLDLPIWVTQDLKLKRILRANGGIQPGAAADYRDAKETIRLYDAAFEHGTVTGEGTLLHEVGHAYWAKMSEARRIRFQELSWDTPSRPKVGSKNFVSHYAQKNVYEDFAETFAAYVNDPEKLKMLAPDKYDQMKEDIFAQSDYFSAAQKRATLKVDSDKPDTKPPYFDGQVEDLIEVTARELKETGEVEVRCVANRVFDDISGVAKIALYLREEEERPSRWDCVIFLKAQHCTDAGRGRYETTMRFPLRDFAPKTKIRLVGSWVTDKAENSQMITPPRILLGFNGTRTARDREKEIEIDTSRIQMTKVPGPPGAENSYRVWIPYDNAQLRRVRLHWAHESEPKYRLEHEAEGEALAARRVLNDGIKGIEMLVHFPKTMHPGRLQLTQVDVGLSASAQWNAAEYAVTIPNDRQNAQIDAKPSQPDYGKIKIAAENVKMKTVARTAAEGKNDAGGDRDILIQVPYSDLNVANGEWGNGHVTVRTPSGKKLDAWQLLSDDKASGTAQFRLSLAPNAEKGDYLIESIEFGKIYLGKSATKALAGSIPLSYKPDHPTTLKLLDRGIRRYIQISE